MRINVGFEPIERLIEKLYNLYIFTLYQTDIEHLFERLGHELKDFSKTSNEYYQHNKIASIFVLLLVSLLQPNGFCFFVAIEHVEALYSEYIKESPYISQEQKRKIQQLILLFEINNAYQEEQALEAWRKVYFSLSPEIILKTLREVDESNDAYRLAIIKEMVKRTNLCEKLSEEINYYMTCKQFSLATNLLNLFFQSYKESSPLNFNRQKAMIVLLKTASSFLRDAPEELLDYEYYELIKIIYEHYPELSAKPEFSQLNHAVEVRDSILDMVCLERSILCFRS